MNTSTPAITSSAARPTGAVLSTPLQRSRHVERIVAGQPTSDGDGVRLTRLLTQPLQQRLDPFLMLDAFGSDAASDYIGGVPSHPHRGFETVTLMLEGRMPIAQPGPFVMNTAAGLQQAVADFRSGVLAG